MDEIANDHRVETWRAFITSHAEIVGAIERRLEQGGYLPLSSYDVLVALSQTPGRRLRMRDLARYAILSRSALTRLVDRLERQGFLARERSGEDRRGAYAVLTEAGQRELERTWPAYGREIQRHFARHLSDGEAELLRVLMSRIAAAEGNPWYAHQPDGGTEAP
jgi:DNA-binding MarR family transcriptional regulator